MCLVDGASNASSSESGSLEQPMRLSVREHARGSEYTLVLSGELDLASRPLLDQALRAVEQRRVTALVLDLSDLEFIDSTGLHGVLTARSSCAEHGCEFALVRGSTQVQRLLELTGVVDELPFRDEAAHGSPKAV